MTTPNPFAAPEPGGAQPPQPGPEGAPGYGTPPPGYGQQQWGQPPYAPPPGYGQPSYGGQAYGAPGYGQPPYGQPAPPYGQQGFGAPPFGFPSARTNGMAIASLVLGVLWLWWIGSVLALVFGYVAKSQITQRGEAGGGLATAGIVLGWIGIGFFALFFVLGFAGAFDSGY